MNRDLYKTFLSKFISNDGHFIFVENAEFQCVGNHDIEKKYYYQRDDKNKCHRIEKCPNYWLIDVIDPNITFVSVSRPINFDSLKGLKKLVTLELFFKMPPNCINFNFGCIPNGVRDLIIYTHGCEDILTRLGNIPSNVTYLELNGPHQEPIKPGIIPNTVKTLVLNNYNHALEVGTIPYGIVNLIIGGQYNIMIPIGVIPSSVKIIDLGDIYNHPLPPGVIPIGTKYIYFSENFNQPLEENSIPNGTIFIMFGYSFNQSLRTSANKRIIPKSTLYLSFGNSFDQIINKGDIPDGVISLNLSFNYIHNISHEVVPNSVLYLRISKTILSNIINNNNIMSRLLTLSSENNIPSVEIKNKIIYIKYFTVGCSNSCDKVSFCSQNYSNFEHTDIDESYVNKISFIKNSTCKNKFEMFLIEMENKLIGKVIFRELTEKVLNPQRLLRLSDKYNIEFTELLTKVYN